MMSNHYCNSKELEEWWAGWNATSETTIVKIGEIRKTGKNKGKKAKDEVHISGDPRNFRKMQEMLYSICQGIAKKFRPKDDDEYYDLVNEAFTKLMYKIETGRLVYKPTCLGGSPVFNLVTTTVHRILCSYKNKTRDQKIRHAKYVQKEVQEKAPELLQSVVSLYDSNG